MPTSLGPAEILVILVVALIVLGPKRLPEAGRQVGRAIAEVRRWSQGFQDEIRNVIEPDVAAPSYSPTPPPPPPPPPPAEHPPPTAARPITGDHLPGPATPADAEYMGPRPDPATPAAAGPVDADPAADPPGSVPPQPSEPPAGEHPRQV